MKRLALLITLLLVAIPAFATAQANVYLAEAAAGAVDASSCANARAIGYFNIGGNWGTGSTQIGIGTTVHFCGTITDRIALPTNFVGTSGSHITLKFETNAKFSAASAGGHDWIGGSTNAYIDVDGGSNGIIEDTDNGTSLGHQDGDGGVNLQSCSHCTVHDLLIRNLYVFVTAAHSAVGSGTAIGLGDAIDFRVYNVIAHDMSTGIGSIWDASSGPIEIDHCTFSHMNWSIGFGASTSVAIAGLKIHDNDFSDWVTWDLFPLDGSDPPFHHNAIIIFATGGTPSITSFQAYNNYFHGNPGIKNTAVFFWDSNGIAGLLVNPQLFNNVFSFPSYAWNNGVICNGGFGASDHSFLYNNYFEIGSGNFIQAGGFDGGGAIKNNIFVGPGQVYYSQGTNITSSVSDYNNFFGVSYYGPGVQQGNNIGQWRTDTGGDANSFTTNPGLTAFVPIASSSVYHTGANLSSLSITALNTSKNSVSRGTLWSIGPNEVTGSFTVDPLMAQASTSLNLNITGIGTAWVTGHTTISFSGLGITINSITIKSTTSATVNITIAPTASLGTVNVIMATTP